MSERSKIWKKKMSHLELEEDRVKGELEEVTDDLEKRVKTILKATLVVGGVFLAGYGLYKILSPKKQSIPPSEAEVIPERIQEAKPVVTSGFNLKNMLLERLTLALFTFLGAKLTALLSKSGENEEDQEE